MKFWKKFVKVIEAIFKFMYIPIPAFLFYFVIQVGKELSKLEGINLVITFTMVLIVLMFTGISTVVSASYIKYFLDKVGKKDGKKDNQRDD